MRPSELLAVLLAMGACAPASSTVPTDTEPAETTFDCELGTLDAEGMFHSLASGGEAEVVLGFQGFLFIVLAARTADDREVCQAYTSLQLVDGTTYGNPQPNTPFLPVAGGWQTAEIMLFLPAGLIDGMIGQTTTVALRIDDAGASCTRTAQVTLVDRDRCVRTEGTVDCPDEEPEEEIPEDSGTTEQSP